MLWAGLHEGGLDLGESSGEMGTERWTGSRYVYKAG